MWLVRKLGSLTFAAVVCGVLMVMLIISTTLESAHGTEFIQKTVYQTKWFDLFLSLLWINIFCSTILRFPFKKKHVGFLITHIGILGLLIGALLSRIYGIEGQMQLFENETAKVLKLGGYQLSVTLPDQKNYVFDVNKKLLKLPLAMKGCDVFVHKVLEHAVEQTVITEGNENNRLRRGLQVKLSSPTMGLDKTMWLLEQTHSDPQSNEVMMGPLRIAVQEKKADVAATEKPLLILSNKTGKELIQIALDKEFKEPVAIAGTAMKLVSLNYYPYARVVKNKLTNGDSNSGLPNPAVEFQIDDGQGHVQRFIKFTLFPDYEAIHQKEGDVVFDVTSELRVPESSLPKDNGSTVIFEYTPTGEWTYKAISKVGEKKEGPVVLNTQTNLGWVDMNFTVVQQAQHAVAQTELVESTNTKEGNVALQILIKDENGEYMQWLDENKPMGFHRPDGNLLFKLDPNKSELPFSLTLKDFRKVQYPGSDMASSYESDVALVDEKEHVKIERTISMNKPLDYKGFRIFQMSFMQNTSNGDGSIFTITKNPGIGLIYLSSIIIFVGGYLQFFVKSSRKQ